MERFGFDLSFAGPVAVAGADEAGRGCLAGPLVAAAVCLDYGALGEADLEALAGLDDSKKLTAPRRALHGGPAPRAPGGRGDVRARDHRP